MQHRLIASKNPSTLFLIFIYLAMIELAASLIPKRTTYLPRNIRLPVYSFIHSISSSIHTSDFSNLITTASILLSPDWPVRSELPLSALSLAFSSALLYQRARRLQRLLSKILLLPLQLCTSETMMLLHTRIFNQAMHDEGDLCAARISWLSRARAESAAQTAGTFCLGFLFRR